mgnify:CR=1 FL=1
MKKIIIVLMLLLTTTSFAHAQSKPFFDWGARGSTQQSYFGGGGGGGNVRDLRSLVSFTIDYINIGIGLIMSFATIAFVYNIVMYFVVKNEEKRAEASQYLIYSIIGLAVIVSFWGLVNVVTSTFGLQNTRPQIQQLYFR